MITITILLITAGIAVWYAMTNKDSFSIPEAPMYGWGTNEQKVEFQEKREKAKNRFFIVCRNLAAILFTGIFSTFIQPFKVERVDAGHVGIMVNLTGDNRGVSSYEYKTGWVVYNTWVAKLYEFPTFQQHIEYGDQVVITKGGFQTTIKPSFNYSLIAGNVGDMFVNLRLPLKQIEQQWLMTAIISSVNDVANTWTVDDIFNNREKFEASIIHEAIKRTNKWFTISQLRTNILPPEALRTAIEAKTKAIQEVQVAENRKQVAIAEAMTKIATAKGDSAVLVIEALSEARAMEAKATAVTITPLYIEYLKWKDADPDVPRVPSTMLAPNSGTMFQLK